jgi:hypothetical protein
MLPDLASMACRFWRSQLSVDGKLWIVLHSKNTFCGTTGATASRSVVYISTRPLVSSFRTVLNQPVSLAKRCPFGTVLWLLCAFVIKLKRLLCLFLPAVSTGQSPDVAAILHVGDREAYRRASPHDADETSTCASAIQPLRVVILSKTSTSGLALSGKMMEAGALPGPHHCNLC